MKLVNLFEIKYKNMLESEINIAENDYGFQWMALKELDEEAEIQLRPRIRPPERDWNYDEEQKIDSGLVVLDFFNQKYRMIEALGYFLFQKDGNLYFLVPQKNEWDKYCIVKYSVVEKEKTYSPVFNVECCPTDFYERKLHVTSKYIIVGVCIENNYRKIQILDKMLNKIFVYQMKRNRSLKFFYVTEECIYIGEAQEVERHVTAIKLDSFDIIEKRIEPFFDYQSEVNPIMYSSMTLGDKLCLSYTENVNGKWYETRKIINADLEIEQQYCFVQPLESRFLTADTDTAESLELWFMRTAEGLKIFYTLVDCMTGQNLWELNLGVAGYDTAGWGIKPEFWKDYIVFSAFEKGKKGNGVLVINRTNGQVEFYKKVKGDIRKIIPREDGVYIQSVSSRKYTYYYKLLES